MFGLICWLLGTCAPPPPPAPWPPAPAEVAQAAHLPDPVPDPVVALTADPHARAPAAPEIASGPLPAPETAAAVPAALPAWQRHAVAAPPADGKPTLTLVIDDCGVNQGQTQRAVVLPGPLTLSWLPYAPHLAEQIAVGRAHGHETMLHMPMEAFGRMYPGPNALRTWLPEQTNLGFLRAALDAVPDAVALNQHEGSVASLSVPLMDLVMDELRARGLAFLDSRTIPHSVALARAQAGGLPDAALDVFIDNDPNPAAIRARLTEAEGIARRHGHVIFIGHPRQTTMDVLERYLPETAVRGFVLWPLSATIALDNEIDLAVAHPAATTVAPSRASGAE